MRRPKGGAAERRGAAGNAEGAKEERIATPVCGLVRNDKKEQIAAPVCALVRNDREWRDIPGYDGAYQISWEGQVRTWRWRGSHYMTEPKLLTAYIRRPRGKDWKRRRYVVKLTDSAGRAKEVAVLRLMADTWPEKLGQMTGAKSRRRPVAKVDANGEAVAFYPSARKAAKANHMSYQAVLDRCSGKIKKPYALDGYTYEFCD